VNWRTSQIIEQELLGDDHDLSGLAAKLNEDANLRESAGDTDLLQALIDRLRTDLQAKRRCWRPILCAATPAIHAATQGPIGARGGTMALQSVHA